MSPLIPDEEENFGGSLVLDFRKWWRHVKTIYTEMDTKATENEMDLESAVLQINHF